MKNPAIQLTAMLLFCVTLSTTAQVSGVVFKDFNFNGTQQTGIFPEEPGAFGVQVRAFNAGNIQVGVTKITSVTGAFSFSAAEIPSGTAVRIEFTAPGGSFDSKVAAGTNGSSVQFLTAPSTVANYAIASQQWYSNTADPFVAVNAATNGDPLGGGTAGSNNNLHLFPYDMGNGTPDDGGATRRLPNSQLGSVYGITSQKSTRTLLMAAYLKRHVGFGAGGIGAIYKSTVSATGIPGAATLLVDVNAIGLNVGTSPRAAGALPAASGTQNADPNVFGEVGKRGIGGIALNEDGSSLYLVNMFQNRLQRINVGNPIKASIGASDVTGNWALPSPATAGMVFRPMACKSANGKIYVGGVVVFEKTTNHNLATDTVGARGIVYEFDTTTAVFTEVLRFPFNYRRGFANADARFPFKANWWCGWQNNGNGGATDPLRADYNTAGAGAFTGGIYYPQPMIGDIEFDVNGEMIIGIRDRFGDQMGYQNVSNDNLPAAPTGFGGNNFFRALSSGEVLRAGKNAGVNSYTLENLGTVVNNGVSVTTAGVAAGNPSNTGGNWTTSTNTPWGGNFGPGWGGTGVVPPGGPNPGTAGAYFYFNHNFTTTGTPATLNGTAGAAITGHYFKSDGTLALLPGAGEVIHTVMDPVNLSYAQGVGKLYNSGAQAGNMSQRLQLTVTAQGAPGDPTNMGKAGGMCDLEIITDYQPVEIGNRVWNDANGNGIQDAGETGMSGITVQLTSPGPDALLGTADDIVVASVITSSTGDYNFSTLTVADTRRPASFIGVGTNDILPGFAYQLRIATPAGFRITVNDVSAPENIDNDATLVNGFAAVNFTATGTDHKFDFGFKSLAALGNRVWLDNGAGGGTANDGLQNGTEPGTAGVPVSLYINGTDGLPGTADDLLTAATITDAYGNYFFENLTPTTQTNATTIARTSYNIRVTATANYSFSTQTNTTDVVTGNFATGSDVNILGVSYSVNLTNGLVNSNLDAGLTFSQAIVSSSIGDKLWFDSDSDGTLDAGEPGISGVTVTLYDDATGNVLAVTTSDANGIYLFNNLPNGTYKIGVNAPGGTILSPSTGTTAGNATTNSDLNPATGLTTTITISAAGTQVTGIDAGLRNDANAVIGDFVWNDLDKDGRQDAGEPGIPSVLLELYNPGPNNSIGGGDDILLGSTTTNSNGYYLFPGLVSGKYFLVATTPAGYVLSPKGVTAGNPGLDTKDSDFSTGTAPYTGKVVSAVATVLSSASGLTRDLTIDLGLSNSTLTLHSIGDLVWNDMNGNGIFDAGEPGVPNVTARLFNGSGVAVNNPATAKPYVVSTDANGNYTFADLADGTYIIGFTNLPAGFSFTAPDANGSGNPGSATDGTTDSDIITATGRTSVITLAGVNITKVDGGARQGIPAGTATIGNSVFYDLNNDGIHDASETGVANVRAELLDASGNPVDSDPGTAGVQPYSIFTSGLGEYAFTGLAAGDYIVRFSNFPTGYAAALANAGSDDAVDADATFPGFSATATTTAVTAIYNLQAGEDNLTVDMGIVPAAGSNRIGNFVWNDTDGDGIQDASEPGVAGVSVTLFTNGADAVPGSLDDVVAGVTTTDSIGRYVFAGLANGTYNVGFSNFPAGMKLAEKDATGSTTATGSDAATAGGRTGSIVLAGGTINNDTDAGLISSRAATGDYVWLDINGDGVQNTTETGISGATVLLYASDGTTVLAGTVTDARGRYFFANLNPGSFIAGYSTLPAGLGFTIQNTPGDNGNNTNSDAVPATGKTGVVLLTAGETDLSVDAGVRPDNPASLGDFVWNDINSDGVQGASEPGVPGIIATLYDVSNTVIGTAITDGNGRYLISKVTPAAGYYVIFSNLPPNAVFASQTDNLTPGDATLGSDPNSLSGRTSAFTLNAGQYLSSVDAGLRQVLLVPVKIVSFTAIPQDGKVKLQWTVGEQQDVIAYEAEFSPSGSNFEKIANVAATMNTSETYDAYHNNPVMGMNYYRIKTIDKNGAISYSEIRKLQFGGAGNIAVYPVPANNSININFSGDIINQPAMVSILTASGKLISQRTTASLSQTETIDVSRLANGTYIIRVATADQVITKTIVVAR